MPQERCKEKSQLACKPGSVWLRLRRDETWQPFIWDCACAQPRATHRTTRLETGWALARPCRPYSVLLPVGFAVPSMSPCPRWALTPPFHPYSASGAVCFLWHFPWGRPRRTLSGTVFPWSPDFPRPAAFRHLRGAAARPTGRGSLNDRRSERQRNRRCRPVRRLLNDTRPRNPSRTRPPRAGRPPPAPRRACRSRRSSWQPGRCRR